MSFLPTHAFVVRTVTTSPYFELLRTDAARSECGNLYISVHHFPMCYTGCFKKSFTTLKAYRNLDVFCYILTVQNVVYVLCINFYKLSKL
jgi:hypothetical protein